MMGNPADKPVRPQSFTSPALQASLKEMTKTTPCSFFYSMTVSRTTLLSLRWWRTIWALLQLPPKPVHLWVCQWLGGAHHRPTGGQGSFLTTMWQSCSAKGNFEIRQVKARFDKTKTLVQEVRIRWYSILFMLQCIHKVKAAVFLWPMKALRLSSAGMIASLSVKSSRPFYEDMVEVSGEKYGTPSKCIPMVKLLTRATMGLETKLLLSHPKGMAFKFVQSMQVRLKKWFGFIEEAELWLQTRKLVWVIRQQQC